MPTREELFAAYALPDRERIRVRMNFVESADGAVTLGGRSGALGGATDRTLMQVLRAMADVVVVGAGTVRAEGYGGVGAADADLGWRREHGLADQPALAIVSGALRLEAADDVFAKAVRRPVVVTTDASARVRGALLAPVADVVPCGEAGPARPEAPLDAPAASGGGVGTVDLPAMLEQFASRGWTQVLCEGGPHLFGALLEAGVVDEVCVTIAPRFVGGEAGRIVQGAREADRRFALAGVVTDDEGFAFLRYAAV
ncbi:dihydrofolate reductase family protein [Microbacterium cremeum]|uniref:dihydrofolate reductase family protein n=1 Tax=Microbacterium cremeum TaxID=2782169 RepID=UPI00188856C5|nr:dihydrofolate reductase family protein [Microbacterium cremeum]